MDENHPLEQRDQSTPPDAPKPVNAEQPPSDSILLTDPKVAKEVKPAVAGKSDKPEEACEIERNDESSNSEPQPAIRTEQQRKRIYFNPDKLPPPKQGYVAWLDVMGSRAAMSQSLARSAHHIGRLHVAILMKRHRGLETTPFMDGAYIRTESQSGMLDFLWAVFEELAYDFLTAREHRHRFLPRCGLAFGSIVDGVSIPTTVSIILGAYSNSVYREGIYFGYPMVQAYNAENAASPFGVGIDGSARSFAPQGERPLSGLWWRWHLYRRPDYFEDFKSVLRDYLKWCESHAFSLDYSLDRIQAHRRMLFEYFEIDESQ